MGMRLPAAKRRWGRKGIEGEAGSGDAALEGARGGQRKPGGCQTRKVRV